MLMSEGVCLAILSYSKLETRQYVIGQDRMCFYVCRGTLRHPYCTAQLVKHLFPFWKCLCVSTKEFGVTLS